MKESAHLARIVCVSSAFLLRVARRPKDQTIKIFKNKNYI